MHVAGEKEAPKEKEVPGKKKLSGGGGEKNKNSH
jgi:hypothetical protein